MFNNFCNQTKNVYTEFTWKINLIKCTLEWINLVILLILFYYKICLIKKKIGHFMNQQQIYT